MIEKRAQTSEEDGDMDRQKLQRHIQYCRWVWFIGATISLIDGIVLRATVAGAFGAVLLVMTIVQAAAAFPAAWYLGQYQPWARIVVYVLAILSLGSLYSAFKMHAWPSLILNFILASTFAVVSNRDFKKAYKAAQLERTSAEQVI